MRSFKATQLKRPKRINGHWMFWFYDEVFLSNVYVIWRINETQRCEFIKKQFGVEARFDDRNWYMKVSDIYVDGEVKHLLSLKRFDFSPGDYALLAHECLHIAHNVLSNRGVEFENHPDKSNETYTYFLQRIMRTIGEAIKSVRKNKVKNETRNGALQKDRKGGKRSRTRHSQKSRKCVFKTRAAGLGRNAKRNRVSRRD